MKILLIEDDEALSEVLAKGLTAKHYVVDRVKDGENGWNYSSTFNYDLIILDVMLPRLDGISLCQRLRDQGHSKPIILLTSQDQTTTKIQGLDAGADDYIVKPFDIDELYARMRALLRRGPTLPAAVLTCGHLSLNTNTCEVFYRDRFLSLTTKEYELVDLFLRNQQYVFSSDEILDQLWSSDEFPAEATVRSHIRRLRHKLSQAGAPPDLISTLHGRGYYIKSPPQSAIKSVTTPVIEPAEQTKLSTQDQYLSVLNEVWVKTQQRCLNEIETLQDLLKRILQDSGPNSECCDGSYSCLQRSQMDQAGAIAHKLTGTLGMFGIMQGHTLAQKIERILRSLALDITGAALVTHQDLVQVSAWAQELQALVQAADTAQIPTPTEVTVLAEARSPNLSPSTPSLTAVAGLKLMILDDDSTFLSDLPNNLKLLGFQVQSLAHSQQFFQVLKNFKPDALILDIMMPDINGLELCQALRHQQQWRRLPILFLSSLQDAKTQHLAFAAGADDYLCKPISPCDLAQRVLNRLNRVQVYSTYA